MQTSSPRFKSLAVTAGMSFWFFVIAIYGILFKVLRIDLLRLQKKNDSYWLEIESNDVRKMF